MRHGNVLVICNWLYLWQIKWWLAKDMIACLVIVKTLIITSCIHHYRVWNLPLKCTSNQVRSLCWWFFRGLLQWFMRSNLTLVPKVPKEVDNGVNKSILSSTHLEVSNIEGWLGYGLIIHWFYIPTKSLNRFINLCEQSHIFFLIIMTILFISP